MDGVILVCALDVEERAARKGGARAVRVGLGGSLALPDGPLVGFGLAGALVPGLPPGTLVTAERIVDEEAGVLWEGNPLAVADARRAVVCATARVVDDPRERAELAASTGAAAVEMESATLAASGRLAGVVRAISDAPDRPVGCLACAATADGRVDRRAVVKAFAKEPLVAVRATIGARRALASLERAAGQLATRS